MPARPVPQDRLPKKKPLEAHVLIALDDEPLVALEDARAEFAAAEQKTQLERERRYHLIRQPGMTPDELLDLDRRVGEEIDAELVPLREKVEQAQAAAEAATTTYVMRSIGRHAFRELVDAHEARDEDHERHRQDTGNEKALARWNDDTFPPALVQAACVSPRLSDADVAEMFTDWNDSEVLSLFVTALAVNEQRRVVDLGKARG